MKKLKVSLLALSVMAGGLFAASAASTADVGSTADIVIKWGTNTVGNNAPFVFDVGGVPTIDPAKATLVSLGVDTDGSGKVEGVALFRVFFDSTQTNYSDIIINVTGKMSTKGTDSLVSLQLKGNGRSQNLAETGSSSASLKYSGTVAKGASQTVTAHYVVTELHSTNVPPATNLVLGFVATNDATLGGSNTVFAVTTNSISQTNTFGYNVAGTYDGTVNTGIKAVKLDKLKGEPGNLASGGVAFVVSGTNLVLVPVFGLSVDSLDMRAAVVRIGKKLYAGGRSPFLFTSSGGSVDDGKGTYKINLKGLASGRGASMSLNGATKVATNGFVVIGTNPPAPILIIIPGTAAGKAKAIGQSLTLSGGTIDID